MYTLVTYPLRMEWRRATGRRTRRGRRHEVRQPGAEPWRRSHLIATALLLALYCFLLYGIHLVYRVVRAVVRLLVPERVWRRELVVDGDGERRGVGE